MFTIKIKHLRNLIIFGIVCFGTFCYQDIQQKFSDLTMSDKIVGCDFEVFGIVQGVFFRKHTEKQAKALKLKGWCMNTRDGTVKGRIEGPTKQINEMKHWLQKVGSPSSRIDKAVFSETTDLQDYSFNDFSVRR